MDGDERFRVIPIGPSQPPAGMPSDGRQWGSRDPAAACMEVSVRALGRRTSSDTSTGRARTEQFEEATKTMLLFPRGAVIPLGKSVDCGQDLILINERTNRYAHCRVTNVRQTPDLNYVEVEFTHDIPGFWGIPFSQGAGRPACAVSTDFAQSSEAEPERQLAEVPVQTRGKAKAAAAASADMGVSVPAPVPWTVSTPVTGPSDSRSETDEVETARRFFAPQPMECVPLCEPVADDVPTVSSCPSEAFPAREPNKWESLSSSKPRKRGKRLGTAAAAGVCAILLGYHFYSPAEAALPATSGVEGQPGGEGLTGADEARLAPGGSETSGSGEASSVVVSVPEPEIDVVETHSNRVVLVSRMTMPVQTSARQHPDAPELSTSAGQAPYMPDAARSIGLLSSMEPPPPPQPEQLPAAAPPVAETLTPAQLVSSIQPAYPQAAREARTQGDVVIETTVDTAGQVTQMRVLSGSPLLREAAISALARWKFQPALLGTRPVTSSTVVTIHFRLQ